jgi:hypothetical protein
LACFARFTGGPFSVRLSRSAFPYVPSNIQEIALELTKEEIPNETIDDHSYKGKNIKRCPIEFLTKCTTKWQTWTNKLQTGFGKITERFSMLNKGFQEIVEIRSLTKCGAYFRNYKCPSPQVDKYCMYWLWRLKIRPGCDEEVNSR